MDPEVFARMTTSILFKTTKEYHQRQLRLMFHRYYQPRYGPNWIIYLSDDIIRDLRLHLSWEIGKNVFDKKLFPRYIIGKMILDKFEKIGILPFLLKAIEYDRRLSKEYKI